MKTIQAATYPVHFYDEAYQKLTDFVTSKNYSSIFLLVDDNTLDCCYPRFMQNFATNNSMEVIQIDAGEEFKNLETCVGVWNAMTELGADRKSLLITLGGGVITDLGGFVASTFKRGIDFINIPTTLLSMVDASVGGKTGVDLGVLKNQIGLFANPEMVIVDPEYLHTLSAREIRSGTAEIIKYGLTFNIKLFNEINNNKKLDIRELIHESVNIKNNIVLEDPTEKNIRKVLNFGHTIGHAIESYFLDSSEKESLTHGEAIAIGMVCESYLSNVILNMPMEHVTFVKNAILEIYGKIDFTSDDYSSILEYLKHDKKNVNGEVNFVLLNDYENFQLDCRATPNEIIDSLNYYLA